MRNAFVAHNSLLGYRPKFHGFTEKAHSTTSPRSIAGLAGVPLVRRSASANPPASRQGFCKHTFSSVSVGLDHDVGHLAYMPTNTGQRATLRGTGGNRCVRTLAFFCVALVTDAMSHARIVGQFAGILQVKIRERISRVSIVMLVVCEGTMQSCLSRVT